MFIYIHTHIHTLQVEEADMDKKSPHWRSSYEKKIVSWWEEIAKSKLISNIKFVDKNEKLYSTQLIQKILDKRTHVYQLK